MTRKHYVMVANSIRSDVDNTNSMDGLSAIQNVAYGLATAFAMDNPRFDRERFLNAALGDKR